MFFGAQLEPMYTCHSVPCDLCDECTRENVACGTCSCLHLPSIAKEFHFQASEKAPLNKKTITTLPELTRKNVLDSATGFPVTSKDKSSILFGHRLDNDILQVLRIDGFFVVLIAVQDEWVYFLLKSLSHVHHAVFSFLVLLQRSPVVD